MGCDPGRTTLIRYAFPCVDKAYRCHALGLTVLDLAYLKELTLDSPAV